jgi:hypothetical protein
MGSIFLAWPRETGSVILWAVSAFLLVSSVGWINAGLKRDADGKTHPSQLIRAGIALITGIMGVIQPLTDYVSPDTVLVILSVGLISTGAIGLYAAFLDRAATEERNVMSPLGALGLGGLLVYGLATDNSIVRWLGYIAVASGVVLLGYALGLYLRSRNNVTESGAPTATHSG